MVLKYSTDISKSFPKNSKDVKKQKPFFNPNPDAYASEMKKNDQWLYSHLVERADGTWSKPPCDANGYYIDGTDPNNLTSFEDAFPTCKTNLGKLSGLVYSIQESSPIKAMDFDHVYDPETGVWNQQALQELKSLNTRVEWSPSHTGVHVLFTCPIMLENGNKTQTDGTKREIYFKKHITTVTAEVVEGFPTSINEVDPELVMQLCNKWFSYKAEKPAKKEAPVKSDITSFDIPEAFVNDPNNPLKGLSPSKDQVMEYCRNAPNGFGEKFDKLFTGNISGYGSDESDADMALAGMIAFHTYDYGIIKGIIQESALWDKKWERNDYCQRTIMKAIRNRWGRF
ncbi:MAG: phage NrS-1 polymerase family protein [Methanosarcina sp.]